MPDSTFSPGAKLRRIAASLRDPSPALKQIGAMMVAESQEAFRAQSFGGVAWPGRAVPNVYGILADFDAGRKKPPERRFEARPALRDTGRLAASIAFRVIGDVVEVGTNLEYAGVHQHGGEVESAPITAKLQKSLWSWLKRQSKERKQQLGWLLNRKWIGTRLKGTVPARPFVGLTDQTRSDVLRTIGVRLLEIG